MSKLVENSQRKALGKFISKNKKFEAKSLSMVEDKELLLEDDLNGLKRYADELKTYIGVNKNRPEMQAKQKELDSIVERLWVALEDVPFIENKNKELILDGEYLDFPKGTTRDKVWHWFDDMYSKGVAYLINDFDITAHRATESKKITEDNEEDLDEAFYEKICRAYIDTLNLEWVTTNPENYDSVVHGYFLDDDQADEFKGKVTPENFKDIIAGEGTAKTIEDNDYYEYETWEDFYEEYVKDEIAYDINDIGVYSINDEHTAVNKWDFYISEEDLTKLGLWNEDMKSEFLDENKKVTENKDENEYEVSLAVKGYYRQKVYAKDEREAYVKADNLCADADFGVLEDIDWEKSRVTKLDESKKVENSKSEIYDELSKVLTDYEGNGDEDMKDDPKPLYDMLVKIQNNWEDTITSNLDESKKVTEAELEDYEGIYDLTLEQVAEIPEVVTIVKSMYEKTDELYDLYNSLPNNIQESINNEFGEDSSPAYCIRWLESALNQIIEIADKK